MIALRQQTITVLTNAFRHIEPEVPPPRKVPHKDSFVYRYAEKTIQQALVQKLARTISALNAIETLLERGFVQEVGVLQRTLDEFHEDIFFLAAALTNDEATARHEQYLKAFYAESLLSLGDGQVRLEKPNLVPRKKIRGYIQQVLGEGINASKASDAGENLSTVYSGYVHAASEIIMDMYGGDPPQFFLAGMAGTPRVDDHLLDSLNYFQRSIVAAITVAKAFGDGELVASLEEYLDHFVESEMRVP